MTVEYIYDRSGWPRFTWDRAVADALGQVRCRQGRLAGRMEALGFDVRAEASLATLTEDVVKSSAIEGEWLDLGQVRSSLARRLGLDAGGLVTPERSVEGVVEMMLDAVQGYDMPLTDERLFGWQAALFPTGRSALAIIRVGRWRDDAGGPMQVVSGPDNRRRVHYEAPSASRLPEEMHALLTWCNQITSLDPVLKAAIAHLWFVTVHPFEDGNGRIARAIADLMLARAEDSPQRFYSVSAQIHRERSAYYDILERTQKGGLDVTDWILWFLGCMDRAIGGAEVSLSNVLFKARFWQARAAENFNERQRKVLNRLFDGLEGTLTNKKWAALAKTSADTALRDIVDLVDRGVLVKDADGGRSTSYSIVGFAGAVPDR